MRFKYIISFFVLTAIFALFSCQTKDQIDEDQSFEFAFLTDIHLKPEMDAPIGFQMAIDKVNELNPDFVLTGGSIAGNAWKGRRHNTKEGFVLIKVKGDDFTWDYIDHGWEDMRLSKQMK